LEITSKALVLDLSQNRIAIISSHIRDASLSDDHEELLADYEKSYKAYEDFEAWSIQKSLERIDGKADNSV
jgi:hypothetical protein